MFRATPLKTSAIFSIPLLALLAAPGCNRNDAQKMQQAAAAQRPPAPVTAVAAVSQDVPVYLDAIGKTIAIDVVAVISQVDGKVTAAHVEDGAYVTKGQLLFEIDPRPFEAVLASAKAKLAQNEAELTWAQADFQRTEELRAKNVLSQLEYEQKKSALGSAEAKVAQAKADVQSAELNLEYTKIYSPIDGRAGARLIVPGNIVKENDKTMLVIQRLEPIYAEFTVTENDLGTVRKYLSSRNMEVGNEAKLGLKVQVDVPGDSAHVLTALGSATTQPADSAKSFVRDGTLTFLDNTVQGNTGTVKLRATVPNSDHYFWPGQFVNCRLILTVRKDAVLVPAEAQQISQQGPFVYVVKPDNTAELRPIVPGQRQGKMIVVESGVAAGEKVVTGGQMAVTPNGKVTITNEAPPAPQSAQARS